MNLFFALPWYVTTALITLASVALSCGGHVLVRRAYPKADFIVHNEVAGFIIAIVGVLYSVTLGFVTVVVWEQFTAAEVSARGEAAVAEDAWRLSRALPAAERRRLASDISDYVDSLIDQEFPEMKVGAASLHVSHLLTRLSDDATQLDASSEGARAVQSRLLDSIVSLNDLRARRLAGNTGGIPPVLYLTLLGGAITVIGFEYLFGLEKFRVQLLMTAATAVLIGLSFSAIVKLDYPYRGDTSVRFEYWPVVQAEIHDAR